MKAFIHTTRFGLEHTLSFHCSDVALDPRTQTVVITLPVETTVDLKAESLTKVTEQILFLGENDILTVGQCDTNCSLHPSYAVSKTIVD